MKRIAALFLALLTLVLPASAAGEDFVPAPDEFVPEIMGEYFTNDANYAIAFKSMYDGETWLWNSDDYFKVASVYKLPLNMYFYEMEASGEIESDAIVGGVNLSLAHYYSLEFSNNEISEAMLDYLGGYSQYKTDIIKYIGDAAGEITNEYYYDNAFTADMVLNILDCLYTHSEDFEEQLEHMLAAQPDEYLEGGELDCEIAQKYGYETYDGTLHVAVAGIVYADEPFLLAILTRTSYGAVSAMGELCDAFAAWDAQRVNALKSAVPAPEDTPDVPKEEPAGHAPDINACREVLSRFVAGVCAVSPLPAGAPWQEMFSMALER